MAEIDPVEFGAMRADVRQLKDDVSVMRDEIKELLAMANAGKGAAWFGRAVAGAIGGVAGAIAAVKIFIR